jgi:hypothetical protein
MFMACADWEKIVEDEKRATAEPESTDGSRINLLKREAKAENKRTKSKCVSFAAYCKESNDSEK